MDLTKPNQSFCYVYKHDPHQGSHAAILAKTASCEMDTDFLVDDVARANFLRSVMQSFGCTYICLWSYSCLPEAQNCLLFWDGFYHEENNSQPSSSSGSIAKRLFDEYCNSVVLVAESDHVPGLAFKTSQQYIELNEPDLQRLAYNDTQRLFYKEARIKNAAFFAWKSGEIEIGLSHMTQINVESEMRNLLPADLPRRPAASEIPPSLTDPNRPSSSSSSLRSLSMDSPEYSSLLFNTPSTSHIPPETFNVPSTTSPNQHVMQALAQMRNIQLPTPESVHAAMTRAIFAIITSPSSSSSSSQQPQQNLPPHNYRVSPRTSAFKKYNLALAPQTSQMRTRLRSQSMLQRAMSFYGRLNYARREHAVANRPTSTQLHHMISERKRREKLNESFLALRSLLPPGTKKDKASLLIKTREYLSSLKKQVAELSQRNQKLEAQLLPAINAKEAASGSSNQRLDIRVVPVPESTSEDRIVDLNVSVTAECPMLDVVIRILEFLKHVQDVSLTSMESSTRIAESSSSNHLILRLRIQGGEWDESAFLEAVRRVVSDLPQLQ